jgi:hypothetical protein
MATIKFLDPRVTINPKDQPLVPVWIRSKGK